MHIKNVINFLFNVHCKSVNINWLDGEGLLSQFFSSKIVHVYKYVKMFCLLGRKKVLTPTYYAPPHSGP